MTLETSSGLLVRVRPEQAGDGPALVDLFLTQMPAIRAIRERWAEQDIVVEEKAAA